MPRFLHTSDWHLGASLDTASREPDHALFLDWLAQTLTDAQIDVLVVAGDVFDQAQPSAEAQQQYFRFLRQVAQTRVRQVVVIGGNHDSASRLEAPKDLLTAFDVHVVGGLPRGEDGVDACVLPVRDANGHVTAAVLAIPFVHEHRIGVRAAFGGHVDLARVLHDGFAQLYTRVADRAIALYGDVPLVATGHMACAGSQPGDAPLDIHLIGTLGALPASIFDQRIQYVALGHIHRGFRIGQSQAWYCGTPVALGVGETKTPRHVLVVQTEGDPRGVPKVERLTVPTFRDLHLLRGTADEVTAQLRSLTWTTPLPALIQAEVTVPQFQPGLNQLLLAAVPEGARLVDVRQVRQVVAGAVETAPTVSLAQLTPEDVFLRLCATRGEEADPALLTAFRGLLSEHGAAKDAGGAR